jgi:hypothetical protein
MDSFIKIIPQKNDPKISTIHTKQIDLISNYIRQGKNVFICGASGVGKSYVLNEVLKNTLHVELQTEHMKSKSYFLSFIKSSTKHVFIEDYDSIFKPIIEQVSDGIPITKGSLLVTTTNMCMYPNFETVFIPKHKPETLLRLVDEKERSKQQTYNAALKCNGNIRNFFTYLDGYDENDTFQSPKEFITEILTDPNPIQIHDSISEHGHIWDIFQENYLDSNGVDVVKTSESFSVADFYDTYMFSTGNWVIMPYFVLHALTIPKSSLGDSLKKDKIRPGRCWTKFGNYKMRKQKYVNLDKKTPGGLSTEKLHLFKMYAKNENYDLLVEYGITPQDFDVINHLNVGNNLKPREVTKIKKGIKNAYERR